MRERLQGCATRVPCKVLTRLCPRFGAVEDSTARVLGAGVDRRYQGRLLPAYEAVQVLQGAMSEWGEENRYQKLLDMAGVTIEDVVEACRYLVTAAGPIAEADRRKHEREKAEAEPFYLRVLSKIKDGLEAVSHTATMDSNLSGEISDWLPRFDLGLEWVACRLEELGFRNLQDLDHSLQKSFSEEATPDFLRSSMDEQKHESK